MIITIDMNSDTALYEQICNSVIRGIAIGGIKPGEQMPTVRSLGTDLGINLHTVNKAYTILKQRGYLSGHRRKGAIVNERQYYSVEENFKAEAKTAFAPIVTECLARGMKEDGIKSILAEIVADIKK